MDEGKLQRAIDSFVKKQKDNPIYFKDHDSERLERLKYYQSYTADKLKQMTTDDFYEYIGKLWSMLIWGNKKYIVDKIINDNGLNNLINHLVDLLYGFRSVDVRWDYFLKSIKGFGPATISELLAYINPEEYVIFNKNTISCFSYLDIVGMPMYNYQYTGKKFVEVCGYAKEISTKMKNSGIEDTSLLAVDYFLYEEILPLTENKKTPVLENTEQPTKKQYISSGPMHDEIKQMIVEIGRLLGFESDSEIKVSSGAKVDAIWEAKIGNMGKAIYVFEVQSKGSIDSLILNLMKAKNNPAVQAVIAVSDNDQLEKIKKESLGTTLENNLRLWGFDEVLEVYDSLIAAHESINKLALVPDSFI